SAPRTTWSSSTSSTVAMVRRYCLGQDECRGPPAGIPDRVGGGLCRHGRCCLAGHPIRAGGGRSEPHLAAVRGGPARGGAEGCSDAGAHPVTESYTTRERGGWTDEQGHADAVGHLDTDTGWQRWYGISAHISHVGRRRGGRVRARGREGRVDQAEGWLHRERV